MSDKHLNVGLLAHVDAGKTTLAEAILHTCGKIRKLGRVDHKDTFFDHFAKERERGITIFSKQAHLEWRDLSITLIDTPGHVDFAAEAERAIAVLDVAILVISGADGIQSHVLTLWEILSKYEIPVVLFINKMDRHVFSKEELMVKLHEKLHPACVDFGDATKIMMAHEKSHEVDKSMEMNPSTSSEKPQESIESMDAFYEELSLHDEGMLEELLDTGKIAVETIEQAVDSRTCFPCFFGSALQENGVDTLLDGLMQWIPEYFYPEEFGARVYKISRDSNGNRLTFLKVTGGQLRTKMTIEKPNLKSVEKINEVRIYDGNSFVNVDVAGAGQICAVTGLADTMPGEGLGYEEASLNPVLEPVMTYRLKLPEGYDHLKAMEILRRMEEEEPLLRVVYREKTEEILVQVMGQVQVEILRDLLKERYDLSVTFDDSNILYKETIAAPVRGIGHFEPLRHYAEVHLLLEPMERGSGLWFDTDISTDMLAENWQRLVLTHLQETKHLGVLTGSELTDVKITLIGGGAHIKHTEGGDFRQATYRAIRQGLAVAQNVLLEPVFKFYMELPTDCLGRAMSDIKKNFGSFDLPESKGDISILRGRAPVSTMQNYQGEFTGYTRGLGVLQLTVDGYEPCHNTEEVLEQIGYDAEKDLDHPTSSVFCSHGAGVVVPFDEVPNWAHFPADEYGRNAKLALGMISDKDARDDTADGIQNDGEVGIQIGNRRQTSSSERIISQEEIESIYRGLNGYQNNKQTARKKYHRSSYTDLYGKKKSYGGYGNYGAGNLGSTKGSTGSSAFTKTFAKKEEYLLVDGYNIIFAWDDLRELSNINLDSARDKLIDIMSNYQGAKGCTVILVFDAYKVKGNPGNTLKYHNVYVVYTKEAETADQYIEKTVQSMAKEKNITVATSDRLEQMIIWGEGAMRLSAGELLEEVKRMGDKLRTEYDL